jgi:Uma2 family endonuclease
MSIVEQTMPPLATGDNLTREEFLRRWEAQPEIKRAELIGGIVYMPSPVSVEHGDTEHDVAGWLWFYELSTPGTTGSNNSTLLMLQDAPQADVHLRLLPEAGGRSWVEGKYLRGAPELVAEVCRSSTSYDLHQKFELYQQAGVREYLAVLIFEQEIRWHHLGAQGYELLAPSADGIWRSQVFPGLWLAGQALLAGNKGQVLTVLQQGLASPEHQAFVQQLAAKMQ